jgi:hypothetical protein
MGGRSIQIHTFYPPNSQKIAEVKIITSFQIQDSFRILDRGRKGILALRAVFLMKSKAVMK